MERRTILLVSTVPQTLWYFARPHWAAMKECGYDIIAVSSPGLFLNRCLQAGVSAVFAIPLHRAITPVRDLAAVVRMSLIVMRVRPLIVHTYTPKGGLIGMIAATVAGVRTRVYTFNGAVWLAGPGWKRCLLRAADRFACRLATSVVCVSRSLRTAVIEAGVCDGRKAVVLGPGTSHGVDSNLFDPDRFHGVDRDNFKRELGIPPDGRVLGFVGRLDPDKGIRELYEAWQALRREVGNLYLLLCGPAESGRPLPAEITNGFDRDLRVKKALVPHEAMPLAYSIMDVCALPSHREGFPNVALEAASMGVPVVTTTAVGCRDAVLHGVTGLVVPTGEVSLLTRGIAALLGSDEQRQCLGNAARQRVVADFSESAVCARILKHYDALLATGTGVRPPETGMVETNGGAAVRRVPRQTASGRVTSSNR
jgi:glycosyltransferase involved in cell wall biosynthesis